MQVPDLPAGDLIIDIRTTRIIDSDKPDSNPAATFDTLIREVNTDGELILSTEAKVGDGTNEATFDFAYDDEDAIFIAGSANLEE